LEHHSSGRALSLAGWTVFDDIPPRKPIMELRYAWVLLDLGYEFTG